MKYILFLSFFVSSLICAETITYDPYKLGYLSKTRYEKSHLTHNDEALVYFLKKTKNEILSIVEEAKRQKKMIAIKFSEKSNNLNTVLAEKLWVSDKPIVETWFTAKIAHIKLRKENWLNPNRLEIKFGGKARYITINNTDLMSSIKPILKEAKKSGDSISINVTALSCNERQYSYELNDLIRISVRVK